MRKRPLWVTATGLLFIAAGIFGFVHHAAEFDFGAPDRYEQVWILALRLLAIVGGVFVLRGASWARWTLILWVAYHVGISFGHSTWSVVIHALLLVMVTWALLTPISSAYFRGATVDHQ